jgi:hypothetical protein
MTLIEIPDDQAAALKAKAAAQGLTLQGWLGKLAKEETSAGAREDAEHGQSGFDPEKARRAGVRIRELRKGVRLDLRGMSIRQFAHLGHKY